jgi:hypothetical protein
MDLVLKINLELDSLPSPFKFNHIWMEEEYFVSMVKKYWKPLDSSRDQSMMFQFSENIVFFPKKKA